jgi:hypothetical protein
MDAEEQTKEVYAHFGLAAFLAQVLEHAIVNAMVYLDLIPSKARKVPDAAAWTKAFDEFMEGHFEKTLGNLVRTLRALTEIPENLEALLRESLRRRNWLMHGYFRERAEQFVTDVGRDGMISELQEIQSLFDRTEKELETVIAPIRRRYGFSDERLAAFYKEYLKSIADKGR